MPLKVLFLSDFNLPPAMTRAERMMLVGLKSSGIELSVVTHYSNEDTRELESFGIHFHYLKLYKKISPSSIKRLRKIIKEEHFDILHVTFGKAATNALMATIGIKIKIIAYYGSLSLHWYDPSAYLGFLNQRIDHYICVSKAVAGHVKKQLPVNKRGRVTVIPRGCDTEWLKTITPVSREELNIPENAFIVCCVAIVRKVKGLSFLIDATKLLPPGIPIFFILVGNGTDSEKIKKLISQTPYRDNFRITGKVPFAPGYIAACDLYIQPSISEGLGRALAEAMSLGKTVIATDGGGTNELITNNVDGIILPTKSPSAIADAIVYCLKNSEALQPLREKAKGKIENNFPINRVITDTLNLYYKITGTIS